MIKINSIRDIDRKRYCPIRFKKYINNELISNLEFAWNKNATLNYNGYVYSFKFYKKHARFIRVKLIDKNSDPKKLMTPTQIYNFVDTVLVVSKTMEYLNKY